MPGKRLLLDTNAVVALLQGHTGLATLTDSADWLGISVITALEFSGFAGLADTDRQLFAEFTKRVSVIDLTFTDQVQIDTINALRRSRALKLPDGVLARSPCRNRKDSFRAFGLSERIFEPYPCDPYVVVSPLSTCAGGYSVSS